MKVPIFVPKSLIQYNFKTATYFKLLERFYGETNFFQIARYRSDISTPDRTYILLTKFE